MKRPFSITLFVIIATVTATAQVQLTENWDSGNSIPTSSGSAPTTPTDYSTSSGTWTFFRSYRHGSAYYSSPYAARLLKDTEAPTDTAYIVTPTLNTVGTISLYGYATSAKPIYIFKSYDSGSSWTLVDSVTTGAGVFELDSVVMNDPSSDIRLKIQNGTGSVNDQNVDDIFITSYSTAATIQTSVASLTSFGTVVAGANSSSESYTVSGSNLVDDITVTAPAGYGVSTDNSTFTDSVVLAQSGGTVPATTIYARFSPSSATGTVAGDITHTSTDAAAKNVSVSGVAIAAEPTTQAAISFGTVTGSSIVVNFSGGDGARRILAARSGSAVNWGPADGAAVAGVSPDFPSAADQGSGNRAVYEGSGSTMTLTGLTQNTTYHFAVYEYNEGSGNSQNYLLTSPGTGSQTTLAVPTILVSPATLAFGNVETTMTSSEKTYALSASSLSPASGNLTVTPPSGYEVSLSSGSGFGTGLIVPYAGGVLGSTTVYVRFTPLLVQAYNGNITSAGGGASTENVAVTGNGVPAGAANEFEAEDGIFYSAWASDQYAGYSGTGYVDIADKDLAALEIIFRRDTASSDSITVTFANGGSSRAYAVTLNGSSVGSLTFPSTGSWTAWSTVHMVVPMVADVNRLKFASTTNGGNANIDKIFIHGQAATPVYRLILAGSGAGSVGASPSHSDSLYDEGETVTLTATPSGGYDFYRWGGTDGSTSNPFLVTMNSHKTEFGVMIPSAGFGSFPYQADADAFASVDALGYSNGTTGGSGPGMITVFVTDAEDLAGIMKRRVDASHALNFPPLTVYVIGTLSAGGTVTDMLDVKDLYDVSIVGAGTDATVSGFGFNVVRSKNVIIRNITFQNSPVDGISVQANDAEGTGNHIWIDHCTFTNHYDGALDITHTASYVTVSWNHFHHHNKNSLVGHSDSNTEDVAMKITYHHNYFDSTVQRNPRVRFGDVHVYNNYYRKNSLYGVSSNLEADVMVEGNYFINVPIPTETSRDASPPGDLVERYNMYVSCGVPGTRGTAFEPSTYYSYSLDSAVDIPSLVSTFAGAGKWDFSQTGPVVTTFALSVSSPHGSVIKNPNQVYYDSGSVVQLTAVPDTGYHFVSWSGDLTGSSNPDSIIMDGDRNVTANSAIDQFTITSSAGDHGSISPLGSVPADYGDSLSFTITPDSGYHVLDVLVDSISVGNPTFYTFTNVSADHTIDALFEADSAVSFTLTVIANNGSIQREPDMAFYPYGTVVRLTAIPAAMYHFTGWSGDLSGSSNPDSVVMMSAKSVTAVFDPDAVSSTVAVDADWNMISLPSVVAGNRKSVLFPTAVSNAFRYSAGYVLSDSLFNGVGYWLKFASAETVEVAGPPVTSDTIAVHSGWNMIGATGEALPVSGIMAGGGAGILTPFYGFDAGYLATDSIMPGKAYWVKSSGDGVLCLDGTAAQPSSAGLSPAGVSMEVPAGLNSVTITDAEGSSRTLYFGISAGDVGAEQFELPPVPPEGIFDARFGSGRYVETYPGAEGRRSRVEYPVIAATAHYPVTLSWNVMDGPSETFTMETGSGASGEVVNLSGEGRMTISSVPAGNMRLVVHNPSVAPEKFALGSNYPNPFNPSTNFAFDMPVGGHVSLGIYDVLGREAAVVADKVMEAGAHSISWDARGLTSGVYFYRLIVSGNGDQSDVLFTEMKKLVLLK